MELVEKARRLLKQAFPRPDKVQLRDEEGLLGVVTSARFQGLDSIDRQQLIWDALDKHLSPEEKKHVVIIIAVTPREEVAHLSN